MLFTGIGTSRVLSRLPPRFTADRGPLLPGGVPFGVLARHTKPFERLQKHEPPLLYLGPLQI